MVWLLFLRCFIINHIFTLYAHSSKYKSKRKKKREEDSNDDYDDEKTATLKSNGTKEGEKLAEKK